MFSFYQVNNNNNNNNNNNININNSNNILDLYTVKNNGRQLYS